MDPILGDDLAHLPQLLDATRQVAERVLSGLDSRPVAAPPERPAPEPLPAKGRGARGALAWFAERWEPVMSASAGPRYLGFVTGGTTPAALAGDWLTGTLDQNAVSGDDSAAVDLELETIGWLRELFGLGDRQHGTFVSGATMSNFTGLVIAREWLGERRGVEVGRAGAAALGPVDVLSGSPHSSVLKAMSMAGLGRDRMLRVATLDGREAVDVRRLAARLDELGGRPAIVVANAGTVNTVDYDDLRAVARLRERYPFWLHVDAAFGAFAALSGAHAHLLDGLGEADSICVDLHKWLNVPYDSAVQFTRRRDLQAAAFHSAAAYLGAPDGLPGGEPDLLHLTPESSRRLRALAAWFSLAAYGREGHGEIVERAIACASDLGDRVAGCADLRLLAPVRLNVVCFTLARDPSPDRVAAFVRDVAASGEAFVTPTVYEGVHGVRAAFSNWRTGPADVERVFAALAAAAAAGR
ncbi:MAG TPA: pyridoxal-dependent decarboxylase [Streptosporangiaceae bacterium]